MIRQLASEYPVSVLCEVLGVARSTVYYEPQGSKPDDAALLEAIEQVLMRWPFYGYRRVTAQLKREGVEVGETRVRRLLGALDHSASVGRARSTTDSRHGEQRFPNLVKGLAITAPNQVWVADITYLRLGRRFLYLAVVLDAFTRGLRGWHLSHSLEAPDLTGRALAMALSRHLAPVIHHSDQGKQYAAASYRDRLPATTQVSMAAVGTPTENALVERFIRTLKEEHVDYSDYRDFDDARDQLAHWLEVEYMTERIHSSLGYLTPAEFEVAFETNPIPL